MPRASRLPSRFPVGTHYVVEGIPGKDGELLITSRYVVLPNGKHLTLPVSSSRPVAAARRKRTVSKRSSAKGMTGKPALQIS